MRGRFAFQNAVANTRMHTCTQTQRAHADVVCVLRERELGVCLCLHHSQPLQSVFAVSTGSCPLHQTLGNLWISKFSKSFWVSGCVTQRRQSAMGATGLMCLCGISDAFCLPLLSGRGSGDGDRSEARPAVTSSERQTDSGEPFRTLRVLFLRDVL